MADISNLLPNDSEAVFNYQIDKLSSSSFRDAALQTSGAFNEAAFKSTFGFPLYDSATKDGVQRVVTALSDSKHWVFTVLRTMKPINREKLIDSLGLEALPEVNKLTVYSVKHDLDSLSNLLIKANRPDDDLQVCIFDGQTLVFADPGPYGEVCGGRGQAEALFRSHRPPPPSSGNIPGGSYRRPGGSSMAPSGSSMRSRRFLALRAVPRWPSSGSPPLPSRRFLNVSGRFLRCPRAVRQCLPAWDQPRRGVFNAGAGADGRIVFDHQSRHESSVRQAGKARCAYSVKYRSAHQRSLLPEFGRSFRIGDGLLVRQGRAYGRIPPAPAPASRNLLPLV